MAEWLDEYDKLIRMDTPKVVIDNAVFPTAMLVQVYGARKRGVLLDAVQMFADLDLSVKKACISWDSWWSRDVFHVTDRFGRKLTDGVVAYIQQSVGTWTEPSQPVALEVEGLTVLELTGADRTGLISELLAVLDDMGCSVVDARAWSNRGLLACLVYLRDDDAVPVARIESRLGRLFRGVTDDANAGVFAVPACSVPHADRRLHQLMHAARDPDRPFPTPSVSVESGEHGYSVVTVQCPDRPKLLYDVVCTLTDMNYLVVHATVDTSRGEAWQKFYILHADGSPTSSGAEMQRVSQCLQDAIERRSFEGVRLELCTPDRAGLLSDVTRTFRENGLRVAQAEVSTKGDMATSVFYVTSTTAGQAVHQSAIDAVRERVGIHCLVVEEHRPQLYQDDRNGAGIGLLHSLGNLVKMKFYTSIYPNRLWHGIIVLKYIWHSGAGRMGGA